MESLLHTLLVLEARNAQLWFALKRREMLLSVEYPFLVVVRSLCKRFFEFRTEKLACMESLLHTRQDQKQSSSDFLNLFLIVFTKLTSCFLITATKTA